MDWGLFYGMWMGLVFGVIIGASLANVFHDHTKKNLEPNPDGEIKRGN